MDWPLAIVLVSVIIAITVIATTFLARPKR